MTKIEKGRYRTFSFVMPITLIASGILMLSSVLGSVTVNSSSFLAAVREALVIDLTNEQRAENDYGPLAHNQILEDAAREKALHMFRYGYFAHDAPDGTKWHSFLKDYPGVVGENLGIEFHQSEDVVDAWMKSPGHRSNILNGSYTEIGVATQSGFLNGYPTTIIVQMFGGSSGDVQSGTVLSTQQQGIQEVGIDQNEVNAIEQDASPDRLEEIQPVVLGASAISAVSQTSWFQRVLVSPVSISSILLLVIMSLLFVYIMRHMLLEIRHRDFDREHTTYMVVLFIFISGIYIINDMLFMSAKIA